MCVQFVQVGGKGQPYKGDGQTSGPGAAVYDQAGKAWGHLEQACRFFAGRFGADAVLVAKNGVDGVYDDDPRKNPNAKKLESVSYQQALVQGLKVVDSTAFSLCMDNGMPMHVFGMEPGGNITKALRGDHIGTLVTA